MTWSYTCLNKCSLRLLATKSTGESKTKKAVKDAASAPKAAQTEPPSDNKNYQVPEYYSHSTFSYYDIDNDMISHRLPQPNKYEPVVPHKP